MRRPCPRRLHPGITWPFYQKSNRSSQAPQAPAGPGRRWNGGGGGGSLWHAAAAQVVLASRSCDVSVDCHHLGRLPGAAGCKCRRLQTPGGCRGCSLAAQSICQVALHRAGARASSLRHPRSLHFEARLRCSPAGQEGAHRHPRRNQNCCISPWSPGSPTSTQPCRGSVLGLRTALGGPLQLGREVHNPLPSAIRSLGTRRAPGRPKGAPPAPSSLQVRPSTLQLIAGPVCAADRPRAGILPLAPARALPPPTLPGRLPCCRAAGRHGAAWQR